MFLITILLSLLLTVSPTFVQTSELTTSECIPSPWVITDPQTGERTGVILDTIFNPGDDKGAGTCMFFVKFPSLDTPQWMVTFSQSERLKRQGVK